MRGGVSVNDLMNTYSYEDRDLIYKIIEDNIELSRITQQPFI